MEVASMFENMVKGWFGGEGESSYNDFIKELLRNNLTILLVYVSDYVGQKASI